VGAALAAVALPAGLCVGAATGMERDAARELRDLNGDARTVVLCFGDSNTRGTSSGGYPWRLGALLDGRAEVVNAGAYGEWTAGGLARLPTVLDEVLPDYVILLEGINDACRVPLDTVAGNLRAMAAEVRARGAVPLVATVFVSPDPAVVMTRLPRGQWLRCARDLNHRLRSLGVLVLDFERAVRHRWSTHLDDGLHLSAAGVQAVADVAAEAFTPR
jgi:lysophospholipase L1-like esterase